MPSLLRFLCICFLGLLAGCLGKGITPHPPEVYCADYWGTVSATLNKKPLQNPRIWAATRTPCNRHAFDIFITAFTDEGAELVTFTLANLPQRTASLSVFRADYKNLFCSTDTLGSTLTAQAKAGFTGTYKPSYRGNKLVISSYDSVKKEIKGSFLLTMIVDQRKSGSMPDTLKIEQGTFHTKLKSASGKYE